MVNAGRCDKFGMYECLLEYIGQMMLSVQFVLGSCRHKTCASKSNMAWAALSIEGYGVQWRGC